MSIGTPCFGNCPSWLPSPGSPTAPRPPSRKTMNRQLMTPVRNFLVYIAKASLQSFASLHRLAWLRLQQRSPIQILSSGGLPVRPEDMQPKPHDDQVGVEYRKSPRIGQVRVPGNDRAPMSEASFPRVFTLRFLSVESSRNCRHRGTNCKQDQARLTADGPTPGTTFRNPRAAIRLGTKFIQPGRPRRWACRNVKSHFVFTLPGLQRRGVT